MSDDAETRPAPRRRIRAAAWVGLGITVGIGTLLVLWRWLPVWAPETVIAVSPWLDPIVRATAELVDPVEADEVSIVDPNAMGMWNEMDYVRWAVEERLDEGTWFGPEELRPYLHDGPLHQQRVVAGLLRDFAPSWPAVPIFEELLEHDDEVVRLLALDGLRLSGDAAATLAVARAFDDPSPRVRENALHALGWLDRDPDASFTAALDGLESPHPDVASRCFEIIQNGHYEADAAVDDARPALRALLGRGDETIRWLVAEILFEHAPEKIELTTWARLLDDPDENLADEARSQASEVWFVEGDAPTPALIEALGREGADERAGAWRILALSWDVAPIIDRLAQGAGDPDPRVRRHVLVALADSATPEEGEASERFFAIARSRLGDDDASIRAAAVAVFARQSEPIPADALDALAADAAPAVRRSLAGAAVAFEHDAATVVLRVLCDDADASVRIAAFTAVENGGSSADAVAEALTRGVLDEDEGIADAAIRACGYPVATELIDALIARVEGASAGRAIALARALASVLDREDVIEALRTLTAHESADARREAATWIRNAQRRELIPELRRLGLQDPHPDVRQEAGWGILHLDDDALAERFLEDAARGPRGVGVSLLQKRGSTAAVEALLRVAREDEDESIRFSAAAAIARVPRTEAIIALGALLESESEVVRDAARRGLREPLQLHRHRLRTAADGTDERAALAIDALGVLAKHGGPRWARAHLEALAASHPDPALRARAAAKLP